MHKCTKYSKIFYPRNYRSRFLVGRLEDAKIEHLVHWPKFEGSSTSLGKQFCKLFSLRLIMLQKTPCKCREERQVLR